MFVRLRNVLMRNLGIKVASLILALSVFAHVRSSEDREFDVAVPLHLIGLPDDLTYRGEVPREVPVRVRARGLEEWRLRAQPPQVRIDLSDALPGLLQRPVTIEDVRLGPGSNAEVRSILTPLSLSLQIEPLVERTLPVECRVGGDPIAGMVQFGPIGVRPDSLWARGPKSLVEPLAAIRTEEVDITGRNQTVVERVLLEAPEGVELEVETVELRVPIVLVQSRKVGPVAVQLPGSLARQWVADPESVAVVLEGPVPLLRSVERSEVAVRAEPRTPVRAEQDSVALRPLLAQRIQGAIRALGSEPEVVRIVRRSP